jgi:hypothetical protein
VKTVGLVATAVGALVACASASSFRSTWRNPSVCPLNLSGKKVAAIVMSDDEAIRRRTEDALAREISSRGGVGVPAYTLLPSDLVHGKEKARELLEQADVEGVVAMRAVEWNEALLPNQGTYRGSPQSGSFWGSGFWARSAADGGRPGADAILVVETLVYSLPRNELVWASLSPTMNPSEVEHFMRELSRKVGPEMEKQGLLAEPAWAFGAGF